jgi:hypothetical protein
MGSLSSTWSSAFRRATLAPEADSGSRQPHCRKTGRRKRGTPNKKTAERLEQIRATGKDPLEVMLGNMRWAYELAAQLPPPSCPCSAGTREHTYLSGG